MCNEEITHYEEVKNLVELNTVVLIVFVLKTTEEPI